MTTTKINVQQRAGSVARLACYHARYGKRPAPRYGQRVTVLAQAKRGTHPRNVLVAFRDGTKTVTSIGCLRWKCDKHS